jgi:hypothetical protein
MPSISMAGVWALTDVKKRLYLYVDTYPARSGFSVNANISKGYNEFWRWDGFTRRVCTLSMEGDDENNLCMV